jgi:hypothetical protein
MFPDLINPGGKLNPRFMPFPWSAAADYAPPFLLFGGNGLLYACLQDSGPGTEAGAKDPANPDNAEYWGKLKTSAPDFAEDIANKGYVDVETAPIAGKLDTSAYEAQTLGIGQTWRDVKSQRALDTNYTNTTGRPIALSITSYNAGGLPYMNLYINDVLVAQSSDKSGVGATTCHLFYIVLPGDTYKITMRAAADLVATQTMWCELR